MAQLPALRHAAVLSAAEVAAASSALARVTLAMA